MATITFNKFDLGIDHRKGASVSEANRLIEMKNAHVTTGLATEKRPGLTKVADLEPGTAGLFAANGVLNTFFCGSSTITHANPLFVANRLVSASYPDVALADVAFADTFNGFFYVAATHTNGYTRHYYNGTEVADANCPHSRACLKAKSKVFAVGTAGDTVRYCRTADCTDWSAQDDAGFLPTGMNTRGAREARALGLYQDKLVVLMRDGAQVWDIDPDPTAMSLNTVVENVGTGFPRSLATVAGDLYFLSDYGFRSITTMQLINQLSDVDIGSPIDDVVRQCLSDPDHAEPVTTYFYGNGKYMCAIGRTVFVYTVSRTSKIAAWSRYELPVAVDAWAELDGTLYIRSGDAVYKLHEVYRPAEDIPYTDDGEPYEVVIQMPWMNFKKPGVLKRITGIDLAIEGRCWLAVGTDANNPDFFTDEMEVRGNTFSGAIVPFICMGNEFSFRFRCDNSDYFRLDALTVYYQDMGVR